MDAELAPPAVPVAPGAVSKFSKTHACASARRFCGTLLCRSAFGELWQLTSCADHCCTAALSAMCRLVRPSRQPGSRHLPTAAAPPLPAAPALPLRPTGAAAPREGTILMTAFRSAACLPLAVLAAIVAQPRRSAPVAASH